MRSMLQTRLCQKEAIDAKSGRAAHKKMLRDEQFLPSMPILIDKNCCQI